MTDMYVKVYKRKDKSLAANVVRTSYKKGKAVAVKKINV